MYLWSLCKYPFYRPIFDSRLGPIFLDKGASGDVAGKGYQEMLQVSLLVLVDFVLFEK